MKTIFASLNEQEYQLLVDAIPLITILIAGADDEIDLNEKEWAEKLTKIRAYSHHFDLKSLYKDIDSQFKVNFENYLKMLPKDTEARSTEISKKLSQLNDIFTKLNMRTAGQLYSSYQTFAEQIARASGGFLRMMSVSKEESIWMGLPMIDPIFFDDMDEEE